MAYSKIDNKKFEIINAYICDQNNILIAELNECELYEYCSPLLHSNCRNYKLYFSSIYLQPYLCINFASSAIYCINCTIRLNDGTVGRLILPNVRYSESNYFDILQSIDRTENIVWHITTETYNKTKKGENMMNEPMCGDGLTTTKYYQIGQKTTICLLTTKEGFEIIGRSFCDDVSKFDERIGRKMALQDATDQLGVFETYVKTSEKKISYEKFNKMKTASEEAVQQYDFRIACGNETTDAIKFHITEPVDVEKLNFKVKCIQSGGFFEKNKIYEVTKGMLHADGVVYMNTNKTVFEPFESVKDLNDEFSAQFELAEEEPKTILQELLDTQETIESTTDNEEIQELMNIIYNDYLLLRTKDLINEIKDTFDSVDTQDICEFKDFFQMVMNHSISTKKYTKRLLNYVVQIEKILNLKCINDAIFLHSIGLLYLQINNEEKALEYIKKALIVDTTKFETLDEIRESNAYGVIANDLKDMDYAEKWLDKCQTVEDLIEDNEIKTISDYYDYYEYII